MLQNLQDPVKNGNAKSLGQTVLSISRWCQKSIKPSTGSSKPESPMTAQDTYPGRQTSNFPPAPKISLKSMYNEKKVT